MISFWKRRRPATHTLLAAILVGLSMVYFFQVEGSGIAQAAGTNYYVDSVGGSDSNDGKSTSTPWKTINAVQSRTFAAGDTINFKRGSSWSGNLSFRSSGASGNPITLKAYGTGNAPVISNTSSGYSHSIDVYGSYVVVQDFLARDGLEAGIMINSGANYVTVQNNEVTAVGTGVYVRGSNAKITGNNIHDLKMIVNTSGGDDDYGANGIFVSSASNTEVSYNRFANLRAPSYDYGYDGGVVEIWGNVSNLNVHHNYSKGANGYVEAGGGSANNVTFAYNVSDRDYSAFAMLHLSGTFASSISNFKVENNTIVKPTQEYRVLDFGGSSAPSSFVFRNNVVYSATSVSSSSSLSHSNNLYYLYNGASLGFSLGSGEKQADPMFVNVSGGDYHLRSGSPAIDAGANLGYTVDYDNHAVPVGSAPDLGAFEFGSSSSASPTPTAAPPTATPTGTTASPTATPAATSAPPAPTPVPASSLLWSAGMEAGNLNEWSLDGGGGIFNSGTGVASASTTVAHSGKYSAQMSITNASNASQAVRLFRWNESGANPQAYYSVWFYFPQRYSGMNWWNIFQWKSKTSSANDPTFTLNVGNRSSGEMYFYLYNHLGSRSYDQSAVNIPVGRWFQIEAFYKQAADNTGQVTFWQDGVKILDVTGVQTRRSGDQIQWSVDNYTDNINPSNATIYADDAAIGLTRLGQGGSTSPTATATSVPPTATATSVPPTATATSVPPTATPTATSAPATATPSPTSAPATATPAPTSTPPTGSSVLWQAGMETGDLSEWTAGNGGKVSGWGNQSVTPSTTYARTGSYSAKLTISGATGSADQAAQLVRHTTNPKAYYSVWYYLPQSYSVPVWWDIMNFYSVLPTGADALWTLNVGNRSDGSMYLYMFDQANRVAYRASTAQLPVGRWFNVQVYYQQAADNTGRVTVYQDGQQIIDVNGTVTRRSGDLIDWVVCNETANINPSTATIYVDDATISSSASAPTATPSSTPVPSTPTPTATPSPTSVPATATPTATPVTPTPAPTPTGPGRRTGHWKR